MLTEAEASEKWCPFVRITPENDLWKTMTNREDALHGHGETKVPSRCIGSACMAWRVGIRVASDSPAWRDGERDRGFCGLAGRPA